MLEPKIRITLLEETGAPISDRLVSLNSELYSGPKSQHRGPFKIEVDLYNQRNLEDFRIYLDQLIGLLPIEKKSKRTQKEEILPEHPIDEMIDRIKKCKDQDKVIEYLKEQGYRFVTTQCLEELQEDGKLTYVLVNGHELYQWMVKMVKEAKDPANDKYDFSLMVGIKLMGTKKERIQIYQNGLHTDTLSILWPEKSKFNMKEKKKLTVFPKFMTIQERKDWRKFDKKFLTGKKPLTKNEEKFYLRWKPEIEKMNNKEPLTKVV